MILCSAVKQQYNREIYDGYNEGPMKKEGKGKTEEQKERQSSEDIGLKPSLCFSGMTLYWNITHTLCVCVCVCSASCWGCVLSLLPSGFKTERETHRGQKHRLWIHCVLFHFCLSLCVSFTQTRVSTEVYPPRGKSDHQAFFQKLSSAYVLCVYTVYSRNMFHNKKSRLVSSPDINLVDLVA